jgi:uncharacterized repeat protein (TIGR03803 family)/probable HAF family extracellular repeat protein
LGIGLLTAHSALAQQYTLTVHGEHVYYDPRAINAACQVVGNWGLYRAFIFSDGVVHDLGPLPGTLGCRAFAINDNGHTVGWCYGTATQKAFIWTADKGMAAPPLPDWWGAMGINNQGHVVGWHSAAISGATAFAFLYRDGVVEELGPGYALGINNQDEVVGHVNDENGLPVAQLWDQDGPHGLDDEGGSSVVRAIGADGIIAGESTRGWTERGYPMHAVLWTPDGISDLGTLRSGSSTALAMTGDLVVGGSDDRALRVPQPKWAGLSARPERSDRAIPPSSPHGNHHQCGGADCRHGGLLWRERVLPAHAQALDDDAPLRLPHMTIKLLRVVTVGICVLCTHSARIGIMIAAAGLGSSAEAEAQVSFAVLHVFGDVPDGTQSFSSLAQAPDGSFYGTTTRGGAYGMGSVFQMMPVGGDQWSVTILHSFAGTADDGADPTAGLILASDGNFYGVATATSFDSEDIPTGPGSLFQITPDGTFTTVYAFSGPDGSRPTGTLFEASDGNLYGTTYSGGAFGRGTVFRLALDDPFTVSVVHDFGGGEGAYPRAGLIESSDGFLYGCTERGGAFNYGVLYRLAADGTIMVLHEFTAYDDGGEPEAALLPASDGALYGTTHFGGPPGLDGGTIFQLTLDGEFQVLHAFAGTPDAAAPYAALIQAFDGNFYGTTIGGGSSHAGTIFQMTPDGTVTILHEFDVDDDGAYPFGTLLQTRDRSFLGTTTGILFGSGARRNGVVFRLTLPGSRT